MASGSSDGEQQRNRNHNKLKYLMDTLSDSHSSVQAGEAQSASDPEHKVVPASRRFRDPVVGDVVYVTSGPHIGKQVRVTSLVTSNKELLNVRFLHAGSSEGQNGLRIFKDHLTLDKDAPGLKGKKAARCNLITGTWGKSPYDHRTVKATHPPSPQKQQHRPSNPAVSPHLPTARPAQVSPSLVFPKGEIVDILSGAHRGKIATVLGTVRAGPGLQNRLALRDEVHMDVFLYPSQLRRASGGQPPQKVSHPPALAQTATAKPVPEPPLSRRGTLPAKGNNMPARVQPGPTSATMPATPQALQTASPPKESRPLAARAHAGLSPAPRVPPLQRLVCGTTASASTAVGTNRTVPLRPPVQQVHRTAPPRATVPVPVAQVRVPEPNLLKISDVRLGDTVRIMRGPWWGKTARVQRWGGKPGTIVVALLSDLTSTRRICESEVVVTSRRVE